MPCMRHCCLLESQLAGCCTLSACHTIDLRGDLSLSSTCALLPTQELRQAGTLTAGSTELHPATIAGYRFVLHLALRPLPPTAAA